MPLNELNLDVIHQAFANIRLESLDLSKELKRMLESVVLEGNLTTTEIRSKLIAK